MKKMQDEPPEVENAPPTASELQLQEVMDKVLENPLLREKILEHVIYPSDEKVNYEDVQTVRLVQKSWLISTSNVLRRNGDPVYNVSTFIINSPADPLNRFVSTITQPERIESVIPPISLYLACVFFVPENHEALSKFLVSCGPGLTSLEIVFPKGCTLPFLFPRFYLPNLQQLRIKFVLHSHADEDEDNNITIEDDFLAMNTGVTYFIQQILNSSTQLEKLEFTADRLAESDLVPTGLDLLWLPRSVKTLLIKCPVLVNHLEIMDPSSSKAMYANLSKIEIMASEIPFPEDTINRILVRHCGTLQKIKLNGKEHQSMNVNRPSLLKMPPSMKHLETITLVSPYWLCVDNLNISNYPNLTTFKMKRVSLALFKQITDRYRVNLKSVKKLKIWLASRQDVVELVDHFEKTITLDLERMQRAHLAFSCVSNLDITICGKEICGLKYIFREMGQLETLAINVENDRGNNMTCAAWDGLFIGAPKEIAKVLRRHSDYWPHLTLNAYDKYTSIQNLSALSKLTLTSSHMPIRYGILSGMRGRMVSEVSFHYAFLKMPGLKNLHLSGRFNPNEVMINLWNNEKEPKSLVYGKGKTCW